MCAVAFDETDKDGNVVKYEFMLVNPKIVSRSVQPAYLESGEGCLSVEMNMKATLYVMHV